MGAVPVAVPRAAAAGPGRGHGRTAAAAQRPGGRYVPQRCVPPPCARDATPTGPRRAAGEAPPPMPPPPPQCPPAPTPVVLAEGGGCPDVRVDVLSTVLSAKDRLQHSDNVQSVGGNRPPVVCGVVGGGHSSPSNV